VPDEPCETPTLWAVMSGEDVSYFASKMRNGVIYGKVYTIRRAYIRKGKTQEYMKLYRKNNKKKIKENNLLP